MTPTTDLTEIGAGPTLIFLPGSYSTGSAWTPVQAALKGSYRMLTVSLPGYGGTPEMRPTGAADMSALCDFVAALIDHASAPVHLVGHSFGGLTALATAMRGHPAIASLITFEANPVYTRLPHDPATWRADLTAMHERFLRALEDAEPEAAGIIIDYWSSQGTFAALPERVRTFCRATVDSNRLDWQCAQGFRPNAVDYTHLRLPVTLVKGADANAAIADVTRTIARAAPRATHHTVPGAGHFLISTHPQDCAALIDDHMRRFHSAGIEKST